jgi:hypothetical protein
MGDPVANEKPPTRRRRGARTASDARRRGLPAGDIAQTPPSLLLIYHWGSLNKDSLAIQSGMKIDPNLKARLALVAGRKIRAPYRG